MSTSAKERDRAELTKNLLFYVIATAFCALFSFIYELFSHGVYSYFMLFAFAIPLILGVLPISVMLRGVGRVPTRESCSFYDCGAATLTLGSVFQGVLEIFGTSNKLVAIYPLAAIPLLAIGIILYIAPGDNNIMD